MSQPGGPESQVNARRASSLYMGNQTKAPEPYEIIEVERLQYQLQQKEKVLFDDSTPSVYTWETCENNAFPENEKVATDRATLQSCLKGTGQDPQVRHLFIEADDSRSALNCSAEMFRLICSHHQIESSFLESLNSFGDHEEPIDLCLAHFRGKIPPKVAIPGSSPDCLARPERQIQMSYLLRSVERGANANGGIWNWNIRQAANYHSFDLKTGKSFWTTIKANDVLRKRIERFTPLLEIQPEVEWEETSEDDSKKKPQEILASHLKAALCTHLVLLSWCDDGWRDFINDLEAAVDKITRPASNALVDDHLTPDKMSEYLAAWPEILRLAKRRTMQSYKTKTDTGSNDPQDGESAPSKNRFSRAVGSLFGGAPSKKADADEEQAMPLGTLPSKGPKFLTGIDPWGSLNKFRFKDIQTLHKQSSLLQKSLLVLDLNAGVMRDLQAYYGRLADVERTAAAFGPIIAGFLNEVNSIIRRLETRRAQLNSLATILSQSIQMYELVLQQRSDHISMMFAESAHRSADQMQHLADKTSRETASMHIITVVTLIFLPATFVATFFQSGIFLWKEAPDDMQEAYRYQASGLSLFGMVCGPLTMLTIGTWGVYVLEAEDRVSLDLNGVEAFRGAGFVMNILPI